MFSWLMRFPARVVTVPVSFVAFIHGSTLLYPEIKIAHPAVWIGVGVSMVAMMLMAYLDQRRYDEKRGDRDRLMDSIVNTAVDGIVVTKNGVIENMNPAAEMMFGYYGGQATGLVSSDLFTNPVGSIRTAKRKDGSEFPAQITVGVWTSKDGHAYNTKIIRDITKQRKSEAELLDREERYRAIVETAVDGIIVIDAKGVIQSFNKAADDMFGYDTGEAIGQPVGILMHSKLHDHHDRAIKNHDQTGIGTILGTPGVTVEAWRKDGSSFPAHIAIADWTVGGERFYTGIMRDLTTQKASEDARDLLAREVDHRAKNALSVVQSLVKLTKAKTIEGFVEAVSGRIEALARAHSLLSQTNWSSVSLRSIAEDELSIAPKGSMISMVGPAIRITPETVQPISMVFHELTTNAFKYGALRTKEGKIRLEWSMHDQNLKICWIETGSDQITEPIKSGFGAHMMKQVVTKQLEGTLDYEWREEGLIATITLPHHRVKN